MGGGCRFQTKQDRVPEPVLLERRVAMVEMASTWVLSAAGWSGARAHHDPVDGWKFLPVEHDLLHLPHKLSANSRS